MAGAMACAPAARAETRRALLGLPRLELTHFMHPLVIVLTIIPVGVCLQLGLMCSAAAHRAAAVCAAALPAGWAIGGVSRACAREPPRRLTAEALWDWASCGLGWNEVGALAWGAAAAKLLSFFLPPSLAKRWPGSTPRLPPPLPPLFPDWSWEGFWEGSAREGRARRAAERDASQAAAAGAARGRAVLGDIAPS
jgi:hypothetical protein